MKENGLKGITDEVAKYISDSISGGLKDGAKSAAKAFNGFYEKLKYQRDFDLISEEEYYTKLEQLRDRYFQKGTDNWVKYTQKIYAYQEKLIKEEKKEIENFYSDIADYATEKLNEVLKKQEKMAENLNSFGGLYNVNTFKHNGITEEFYSLHDLSWDIAAIERYSKNMTAIKERAERLSVADEAKDYLLDRIKEMKTEEALSYMGVLMYADDEKFSKYTQLAYDKFILSKNVAANLYQDEFNSGVEDSYNLMKDALLAAGYEIPENFYVSGSISAQKFGEAFIVELDNQLAAIRNIIDTFNENLSLTPGVYGNTYNTSNTSYNISASGAADIVEQIKRYETIKRFAGIGTGGV